MGSLLSKPDSMLDVPNDVLLMIMLKMDQEELNVLRATNKRLNQIVLDNPKAFSNRCHMGIAVILTVEQGVLHMQRHRTLAWEPFSQEKVSGVAMSDICVRFVGREFHSFLEEIQGAQMSCRRLIVSGVKAQHIAQLRHAIKHEKVFVRNAGEAVEGFLTTIRTMDSLEKVHVICQFRRTREPLAPNIRPLFYYVEEGTPDNRFLAFLQDLRSGGSGNLIHVLFQYGRAQNMEVFHLTDIRCPTTTLIFDGIPELQYRGQTIGEQRKRLTSIRLMKLDEHWALISNITLTEINEEVDAALDYQQRFSNIMDPRMPLSQPERCVERFVSIRIIEEQEGKMLEEIFKEFGIRPPANIFNDYLAANAANRMEILKNAVRTTRPISLSEKHFPLLHDSE